MLLGLAEDDGISIPAYPGLGFDSLAELAQTLARFTGLARRLGWRFDAVVPLDAESLPLAIALAAALDARPLMGVEHCRRDACVLGVSGTGTDPAGVCRAVSALRRRTTRALFYAAGVTHPVWEYAPAMQVASVPSRLEFPWGRGEAMAPEHAEALGAELGAALERAAPDATLQAQVAWYSAPGGHPRLGFSPTTLETLIPSAGPPGTPAGSGLAVQPGISV